MWINQVIIPVDIHPLWVIHQTIKVLEEFLIAWCCETPNAWLIHFVPKEDHSSDVIHNSTLETQAEMEVRCRVRHLIAQGVIGHLFDHASHGIQDENWRTHRVKGNIVSVAVLLHSK